MPKFPHFIAKNSVYVYHGIINILLLNETYICPNEFAVTDQNILH